MQAVVFKGKLQVKVEQRHIPKIEDAEDIIVKVGYTALCGRYVSLSLELLVCNTD